MKKYYLLLCIIGALGFQACEGPQGPPGIDGMDGTPGVDGEDGIDGGLFLSSVLETSINFTEENEYRAGFLFEIPEADNLLIYLALEVDEEENVVWMPLPQTFFVGEGMVIYNYYFTREYFSIFLNTTVAASELTADFTENQVFRVVVVPGQYLEEAARVDFNDYHAVMNWLGKTEQDVEKISPK